MATSIVAATISTHERRARIPITDLRPHSEYSSSIGVPGCKINTDRVAYWPLPFSCDNLCVRVYANDRNVTLLRIDRSKSSWDISYDAWNYLQTGYGAREHPVDGGGIYAEWEDVPISECFSLMEGEKDKLPFIVNNNPISKCAAGTWVMENYVLYNIEDPRCLWGYDERCEFSDAAAGLAYCPRPSGIHEVYAGTPMTDLVVGSGMEQTVTLITAPTPPPAP